MDTCFIAAMIPTVAVLVGILIDQTNANRLDAGITSLESSLRGEIAGLRGEMTTQGNSLRGDMASIRADLSSMKAQFDNDILMLVRSQGERDVEIAKLQDKVKAQA